MSQREVAPAVILLAATTGAEVLRKVLHPLRCAERRKGCARLAVARLQSMREARLRPEYADLYPELTPGQWEPAARIAEVLLARFLLQQMAADPMERALQESHFEFRGGAQDPPIMNPRRRVQDPPDET
jgi:hypothetical protein